MEVGPLGEWKLLFAGTKHTNLDPTKLFLNQEGLLVHEVSVGLIEKSYATFDTDLAI
jgi:hypothetical protein